jgi:hypothetical protein
MRVRIEADAELTPDEAAAVRAAIERFAESGGPVPVSGDTDRWAGAARPRSARRERVVRTGGRDEWQAARDRRRRSKEATT